MDFQTSIRFYVVTRFPNVYIERPTLWFRCNDVGWSVVGLLGASNDGTGGALWGICHGIDSMPPFL